jgi:hypothetical protein
MHILPIPSQLTRIENFLIDQVVNFSHETTNNNIQQQDL